MRKKASAVLVGSELGLEELAQVQGGGLFDPSPLYLYAHAAKAVYETAKDVGHEVYQVGKKVWDTITSWF